MPIQRHISKGPHNLSPDYFDISGAYIQGNDNFWQNLLLFRDSQGLQALEKYRSTRLSLTLPIPKIHNPLRFLRQVSRFCFQKMKQRCPPRVLRRFALFIGRLHPPRAPRFSRAYISSCISLLSLNFHKLAVPETIAGQVLYGLSLVPSDTYSDNPVQGMTLPRSTVSCNPTSTLINIKPTSYHRPTCTAQPGPESPVCRQSITDYSDPPLTPVHQIIRTPTYPPRIEVCDLRKSSQYRLRDSLEAWIKFSQLDPSEPDSPIETRYNSLRRLPYPHIQIAPTSYPSSPPLNMSRITNTHELASPLAIRPLAFPLSPVHHRW